RHRQQRTAGRTRGPGVAPAREISHARALQDAVITNGPLSIHGGSGRIRQNSFQQAADLSSLGCDVITYEYPLNERIRTLLRLEALFERANHFLVKDEDSRDHHAALLTLFEILEVASRADLKSELLQELERQKQVLLGFRNNPQIAENVLKQVISDIE